MKNTIIICGVEYTAEQVVSAIKETILSVKNDTQIAMCIALSVSLTGCEYMDYKDMSVAIGLEKYKPDTKLNVFFWFPFNKAGQKARLKTLNPLLKEWEQKL